jgi:two-component system chemotaxis sensor kinase CheA
MPIWKVVKAACAPVADSPAPAATSAAPHPPATAARAEERRGGARDRRAGSEESRFIRVRADKLDHLIDLIGELVIASSGAQVAAQQERSTRFGEAAQRIHDLVQEARDGALGLRMVPIGETFSRFQRVVRDVSKELGKDVALQITGGDTELDKSMVETIADPLMHLVRNSLDHGLETAEDREAAGKPGQGTLALHAYHESGNVIIEVSDDGRGLNRDRILAKAVERELVSPDSVLDDEQVYRLIFEPGFSTAAQVTNLSGRGVGMDVVKRNVESLRGQIKVASTPGRGATMQIRLPLTLAIIDGFLTQVAGVSYVLPLEIVAECIETPPGFALGERGACGCFDLRGEVVPYIDLRRCFGHDGPRPTRQSLIVVHSTDSRIGLLVDRLLGEYQTVIKPLGSIFQHLEGIAGSTILGSGEVALILDVASLERYQVRQSAPPRLARSTVAT